MSTNSTIHQDAWEAQKIATRNKLVSLGANWYDLALPESHILSSIIHEDEQINGIVYGQYTEMSSGTQKNRGALVATT